MTANGTSAATGLSAMPAQSAAGRVDWVDYAKGICIVMVVMMHSVLGVEAAAGQTGFMHLLVAFAKPFRMPDFFLISGLFLSVVIDRDWRTYLDRKVVHFAYFYVLWVTIQFGFKAPSFAAETGWSHAGLLYLESFIEPFGTLWFIYLLPVFFVVTKATTRTCRRLLIWARRGAAGDGAYRNRLDRDRRILRALRLFLFRLSVRRLMCSRCPIARARSPRWRLRRWRSGRSSMAAWLHRASANGRWSRWCWAFAGACAIIIIGTLLARAHWLDFLRFCGEHSIVIYLAFFLPMAATRTLLLRAGLIHDVGTVSLIVTIAGVLGALAIWRVALAVGANFLFERPAAFWIAPKKPGPCCRRRSNWLRQPVTCDAWLGTA